MKLTASLDLSEADRAQAEGRLNAALGSYILSLSQADPTKMDFSTWTEDEWNRFVSIAFDVAAIETFKLRVRVAGPQYSDMSF